MASTSPAAAAEWLVPGAECVVIEREQYGPGYVSAVTGTVEKVGKAHFTVTGVRPGGSRRPDLPLIKFRVSPERDGQFRQAGDGERFVVEPGSKMAAKALADFERKAAEDAVTRAFDRWDKARKGAGASFLNREAAADRGAAAYALADAVVALRAVYEQQGVQ